MIKSGAPTTFFSAFLLPGPPANPTSSLLCEGADKVVLTVSNVEVGTGGSVAYFDVYFNWGAITPGSYVDGASVTSQNINPLSAVSGSPVVYTAPTPLAPTDAGWFNLPYKQADTVTFQDKYYAGNITGAGTTRNIVIVGNGNGTYTHYFVFDNPGATAFKVMGSMQGAGSFTSTVTARALFIEK